MARTQKLSKTLVKYIRFYVLVFVLPITMLIMFYLAVNRTAYREQAIALNQRDVLRTQEQVDALVSRITAAARELSGSLQLTPLFIFETPSHWVDTINRLMTTAVANDDIERLLYYPLRGNEYGLLFAPESTYTVSTFFQYISPYENWTEEEFLRDVRALEAPALRPTETVRLLDPQKSRVLTFLFPTPLYGQPYGVLLFQVAESSLGRILQGNSWHNALLDEAGAVLAGTLPAGVDIATLPGDGDGVLPIMLEGKAHLLCYAHSAVNGWVTVSILPQETVLAQVNRLDRTLTVLLVLILSIGLVVIWVVAGKTYAPLSALRIALHEESLREDEVSAAIDAIERLRASNSELRGRLEQSAGGRTDQLLFGLMRGAFPSRALFNEQARHEGFQIDQPLLMVVLAELSPDVAMDEETRQSIRSFAPAGSAVHFLPHVSRGRCIWLVAMPLGAQQVWTEALAALHTWLEMTLEVEASIGVGQPTADASQLYVSYLQAEAALDLKWIRGSRQVFFFDAYADMEGGSWREYPKEALDALYDAVLRVDPEAAMQQTEALIAHLRDARYNLFQARCVCYEIVNTAFRAMRQHDTRFASTDILPDLAESQRLGSLEDVTRVVRAFMHQLERQITAQPTDGSRALIRQVQQYIRANYTRDDFSIQSTCAHFHISQSNLSHKFKACTSRNLSDFVSELRMERARTLLHSTQLPLQSIAESVGYYDVSGFARKFKQTYGMTPGEFRGTQPEGEK